MSVRTVSDEGWAAAAWMLGVDVPAIRAVADVESAALAFVHGEPLEPIILFERHKFHEYTGGRFAGARAESADDEWAVISSPTYGGYGPYGVQHQRLQAAVKLDRDAAIRATSWGMFQILGDNWHRTLSPTTQEFINRMYMTADEHLRMFVAFILTDHRLSKAIREHNWPTFARIYNGPAYARNRYDTRIAQAYRSRTA